MREEEAKKQTEIEFYLQFSSNSIVLLPRIPILVHIQRIHQKTTKEKGQKQRKREGNKVIAFFASSWLSISPRCMNMLQCLRSFISF